MFQYDAHVNVILEFGHSHYRLLKMIKYKNYHYPNDFWKFACDQTVNIEVIYVINVTRVLQGASYKYATKNTLSREVKHLRNRFGYTLSFVLLIFSFCLSSW